MSRKHAVGAGLLELVVDRAGDDVARRERLHRVVVLHERLAGREPQHAAFAAQRLGDEEAAAPAGGRARRVELDELDVADRGADAVRHRDAVAGRDVGVRRVEVDLAGAAGREHGRARADRLDLAAARVEHVRAEARRVAAVLRHRQQVDRDVVVEHRDVRVRRARGDQRALDLAAGDVLPVDDAARACARPRGRGRARRSARARAARRARAGAAPARALADAQLDDRAIAQPVAGGERVLDVPLEAVVVASTAATPPWAQFVFVSSGRFLVTRPRGRARRRAARS